MARSTIALLVAALVAGLAFRVALLGSVPDPSFDEAWYGIQSHRMLEGSVPFTLSGQNAYTGSLIEYLRVPFYAALGVNAFTLKLPIALLNVGMLIYLYLFTRRFYDARVALIGTILLCFSPWHIIESRFADSVHTALPFFGLAFLYHLIREEPKHTLIAALWASAGLLVHVLFALFLGLLAVLWLHALRPRWTTRSHACAAAVVALAFGLRVAPILLGAGDAPQDFHHIGAGADKLIAFGELLPLVYGLLDGKLFYLRMTGEVVHPVLPALSALLAAASISLVRSGSRKERLFLLAAVLYAIGVSLNVDNMSLRYYLFPLVFSVIASAVFVARLRPRVGAAVTALVVALNVFYVCTNYFAAYARSGGRATTYFQGNFEETSRHFVDLTPLIAYLRGRPERKVALPHKPFELAAKLAFAEIALGEPLLGRTGTTGVAAVFFTEDLEDIAFRHQGFRLEDRVAITPFTVLLLSPL